jgi:hypothetical protein
MTCEKPEVEAAEDNGRKDEECAGHEDDGSEKGRASAPQEKGVEDVRYDLIEERPCWIVLREGCEMEDMVGKQEKSE